MAQTCRECGGSGKCHWCSPKGSGKNGGSSCQMCNGSGICSKCGGSGKEK